MKKELIENFRADFLEGPEGSDSLFFFFFLKKQQACLHNRNYYFPVTHTPPCEDAIACID